MVGTLEQGQERPVGDRQGRTVGGYRLDALIGQGGMSSVYRAYQPQLDRWVAIKILKASMFDETTFLSIFRREARAVAILRHPNILTVYDYGEEAGLAYIVMEYIGGGTLYQQTGGQPLLWEQAAELVIPVGHALAYAHSQGIVHCDVKPSNILMAREDWPLLADFGLLRLRDQEAGKPGLLSGTPTYASPEQIMGRPVEQQSDIYSLALVLYELLTGRLPFSKRTAAGLMLQRLQEQPLPISAFRAGTDPRLDDIVLKALARRPEARYSEMGQFVADLSGLLDGEAVFPSQASPDVLEEPATTRALSDDPVLQEPHLVVIGTGTILSLPAQSEVVLGRIVAPAAEQPDVDLGPYGGVHAGVSRQHARLRYAAEGWLLEDLASTNGTSINMVPLKPQRLYRLRNGDVIRCGRMMLVFFER